jgi:uncharacterized protein DUF1615
MQRHSPILVRIAAVGVIAAAVAAGCSGRRLPPPVRPAEARARIAALLPADVSDRAGWAVDIYAAFAALGIAPETANVCAVIAVAGQESSFEADPTVPDLPRIARDEIDRRAARLGIPAIAVHLALRIPSRDGRSYGERIDAARTERDLSEIFDGFIDAVPMGQRLFGGLNPVRTGGPMQVSIAFAERQAEAGGYPYPVEGSIRDEVFTRRGGLYFGIAHLLDYPAPYDDVLYRFADFNAGRWASRNAAFQDAVSRASGIPLALDGDLIAPDREPGAPPGPTELAVRALGPRIDASDREIERALAQGDGPDLQRNPVYQRVFALAETLERSRLARARVPDIELHGPKLSRTRTTHWFADRVNERYGSCLARAASPPRKRAAPHAR